MPTQPRKGPCEGCEQSNLLSLLHDSYRNLAGDKNIVTGVHLAPLNSALRAKFGKAGKQTKQNRIKYLLSSLHKVLNFIQPFPE